MSNTNKFNIGELVYILNTNTDKVIELQHAMIVAIAARIKMKIHGTLTPELLSKFIFDLTYECQPVYKNSDFTFSMDQDDYAYSFSESKIFKSLDEAKNFLTIAYADAMNKVP